jgi:hypothetical protein
MDDIKVKFSMLQDKFQTLQNEHHEALKSLNKETKETIIEPIIETIIETTENKDSAA